MLRHVLVGAAELLRRVHRQPEARVPERRAASPRPRARGRSSSRDRPSRGSASTAPGREHVDAAVDPVRARCETSWKPVTTSSSVRSTWPNCDGGRATVTVAAAPARAVPLEQAVEVDVDELVAVQRQNVAVLQPRSRREADRAAAAEPLGLARAGDLDAEAGEALRRTSGSCPAAQLTITRVDARAAEPADLPGEQRLAADLDERLRAARRSRPPSARPCRRRGRSPPSGRPVVGRAADSLDREPGRAQRRRVEHVAPVDQDPRAHRLARRRPSRRRRAAATRSRPRSRRRRPRPLRRLAAISTPCRSRAVDDRVPGDARRRPRRAAARRARGSAPRACRPCAA